MILEAALVGTLFLVLYILTLGIAFIVAGECFEIYSVLNAPLFIHSRGINQGTKSSILIALYTSLVVVSTFEYLNQTKANDLWNVLTKKSKVNSLVSTSEVPAKKSSFLIFYWSAQSSVALITSGVYVLLKEYYTSSLSGILLSISMISMGFISYAWWGSARSAMRKLDILNMFLILSFLASRILSAVYPTIVNKVDMIIIFLCVVMYLYWGELNISNRATELLILNAVALYFTTLFAIHTSQSLGNKLLFLNGFSCILGGLLPKAADVKLNFQYGTTVFHILEGIGFAVAYEWVASLRAQL